MKVTSLAGKTVQSIRIFRCGVHYAWTDENTLPIAASAAFIDVLGTGLMKIAACEVDLCPKTYPALGLEIRPCTLVDLKFQSVDGQMVEAEFLEEASALLPFVIGDVEQSDPLGEDTVNQYALIGSRGQRIVFQHMMPPMTLGIAVVLPADGI